MSNTVGSQGEIKDVDSNSSEDDGELAVINKNPKIGKVARGKTEKSKGLK